MRRWAYWSPLTGPAEIDAAYASYEEHPPDERDDWGDLASFLSAADKS
jgi:hypothetical protein